MRERLRRRDGSVEGLHLSYQRSRGRSASRRGRPRESSSRSRVEKVQPDEVQDLARRVTTPAHGAWLAVLVEHGGRSTKSLDGIRCTRSRSLIGAAAVGEERRPRRRRRCGHPLDPGRCQPSGFTR